MGRTLWLIGMMGAGKSSVAPLVADALDRDWVDSDAVVEEQTGRSVAALLAESEDLFRIAEANAILSLAGRNVVVATGGGVVMSDVVESMRASGLVVWLRAGLSSLVDRVGKGEGRPLLPDEPEDALQWFEADRRARYRAAAHEMIDTDDREPSEVAERVVRAWANASSGV